MTLQFEQIKIKHYLLLDSLFGKTGDNFNSDVMDLLRDIKSVNAKHDPQKSAYLHETIIFWTNYYRELCVAKQQDVEYRYRRFRKLGGKLQGLGYYDLAADLLVIATNKLDILERNIHRDILKKWTKLANDMSELRTSFNTILSSDGQIRADDARVWLTNTRKRMSNARRSLKNTYRIESNAHIENAIRSLGQIEKILPGEKEIGQVFQDQELTKLKEMIWKNGMILVFADLVQNKVTVDYRDIDTAGGDYVQGNKKVGKNPKK